MTDTIRRLAEQISSLSPDDKKRLFDILAARGDLPPTPPAAPQARTGAAPPPAHDQAPASPDYVIVFDGGSRGNPGLGYGSYAITRVQDGAQRLERLQFGGQYTNNEAEYDTLIAALEDLTGRIEEAGRRPEDFWLEVRGDSSLVINQLQGRWRAKEPRMAERRERGRRLIARFRRVDLKFQPREASVRVLGH